MVFTAVTLSNTTQSKFGLDPQCSTYSQTFTLNAELIDFIKNVAITGKPANFIADIQKDIVNYLTGQSSNRSSKDKTSILDYQIVEILQHTDTFTEYLCQPKSFVDKRYKIREYPLDYADKSPAELEEIRNRAENARHAQEKLDPCPYIVRNINSLEYPNGQLPDVPHIAPKVQQSIIASADHNFPFLTAANNAQGKFDMCFTNPPFGTKVEVEQSIVDQYELGHMGYKAPEVLFIEACYNFLKPGGKLAIVLPDGILGNPNTESVRIWILQHFKLLASIDLPVETFLPQVGVQASLLFLQKKTDKEKLVPIDQENYDVFMAIVEHVGKDRRGVPIYERDDDGAELLFHNVKKWLSWDEKGRQVVRTRNEKIKHLADDLPKVSDAYKKFKEDW